MIIRLILSAFLFLATAYPQQPFGTLTIYVVAEKEGAGEDVVVLAYRLSNGRYSGVDITNEESTAQLFLYYDDYYIRAEVGPYDCQSVVTIDKQSNQMVLFCKHLVRLPVMKGSRDGDQHHNASSIL